MAKLTFLGAIESVGASGMLVEDGANRIVMDYGVNVSANPPTLPLPVEGKVTAAFLTHCHLDHSGAFPLLVKENGLGNIHSTKVTKELAELLLMDSIKVNKEEGVELKFDEADVKAAIRIFETVGYRQKIHFKNGTNATLFDAGHIPGSAFVGMNVGGKHVLYTGDFNTEDTVLIKGCEKNLPETDVLITESTYADRNHSDRETQEKELVNTVRETLANGGVAVISSLAIGRADELLLVLDKHGIDYPVYIDGMAKKAITIINKNNSVLKNPKSLDKALEKAEYITEERDRKKVLGKPCVVITTSGMLKGGPVMYYLKKLHDRKNCSLMLTCFQVEGTPGNLLLKTGHYVNEKYDLNLEMKMRVRRLDFSSHVDRDNLFKFIKNVNPQRVLCMHGDKTEAFAQELKEEGFEAVAPSMENRVFDV